MKDKRLTMSLSLEDIRIVTEDFAFELRHLEKSHPVLGDLHIFYAEDVELPKAKDDTIWYSMKWPVRRLEDAIWNIR